MSTETTKQVSLISYSNVLTSMYKYFYTLYSTRSLSQYCLYIAEHRMTCSRCTLRYYSWKSLVKIGWFCWKQLCSRAHSSRSGTVLFPLHCCSLEKSGYGLSRKAEKGIICLNSIIPLLISPKTSRL